jgi:pimeloyl-ACP methyl ester carboxylesterase
MRRLHAARIAAPILLVVAAAATSCGETSPASPSPEAIATAEAVSRVIAIAAPYGPTPEGESEPDVALDGRVFGSGPTGVILVHMRPSDQTSWFPFATELAATGEFTVLTFDFRGYGDSSGDKQFDRIEVDLDAAYRYMRDDLALAEIFLVGASMGGTASLVVASRERVAGVVSISSQAEFPPSGQSDVPPLDAVEAVAKIRAPKLFITSEDDPPAARSQEELWIAAPPPKSQMVYEGSVHGTDLFQSEHAADFRARLFDFLGPD